MVLIVKLLDLIRYFKIKIAINIKHFQSFHRCGLFEKLKCWWPTTSFCGWPILWFFFKDWISKFLQAYLHPFTSNLIYIFKYFVQKTILYIYYIHYTILYIIICCKHMFNFLFSITKIKKKKIRKPLKMWWILTICELLVYRF